MQVAMAVNGEVDGNSQSTKKKIFFFDIDNCRKSLQIKQYKRAEC
jgi:hypothetical protein